MTKLDEKDLDKVSGGRLDYIDDAARKNRGINTDRVEPDSEDPGGRVGTETEAPESDGLTELG